MGTLFGENILIIIPKNQFCEKELYGLRSFLEQQGGHVVVLSKSGKEARGMNKDRFQPDGMIIDWNKQPGVNGKYHAVIVLGGKGARKSLWDDPIIPQILTDHSRYGSIIGAVGSALVVLVRTSLVVSEIPLPKDASTRTELESLSAVCIDTPVVTIDNLVLGQGSASIDLFAQKMINLIRKERC